MLEEKSRCYVDWHGREKLPTCWQICGGQNHFGAASCGSMKADMCFFVAWSSHYSSGVEIEGRSSAVEAWCGCWDLPGGVVPVRWCLVCWDLRGDLGSAWRCCALFVVAAARWAVWRLPLERGCLLRMAVEINMLLRVPSPLISAKSLCIPVKPFP